MKVTNSRNVLFGAFGSSFTSQLLENFTPAIKAKYRFLLQPLQFFSELNGLVQLFFLVKTPILLSHAQRYRYGLVTKLFLLGRMGKHCLVL